MKKWMFSGFVVSSVILSSTFGLVSSANAQPTISVGHWDYNQQTVTYVIKNLDNNSYAWAIEDFVEDTLPGEWFPSSPSEALISGALLIRSGAYNDIVYPESSYVSNASGMPFNLRDSTYQGWKPDSRNNASSSGTNSAVNGTFGRVIYKSGSQFFPQFNSCTQNESVSLANEGYNHTQILTDPTVGLYSSSNKYGCGEPYYPSLSYYTAYTY